MNEHFPHLKVLLLQQTDVQMVVYLVCSFNDEK